VIFDPLLVVVVLVMLLLIAGILAKRSAMLDFDKLAPYPTWIKVLGTVIVVGLAAIAIVLIWTKPAAKLVTETNRTEERKMDPTPDIPKANAGPQSGVSIGQQGGITAGTINLNVNTMQPRVEGVNVSMQQIPSPKPDAPYAVEITVQVASSIQPFAIGVVCDQEIAQADFRVIGVGAYTDVGTGYVTAYPKTSYYLRFGSPPVTPSSPLVITVMCRQPFKILSVERMR
jgi:hypothetical protein